jgi:ribosomal protein L16 Arg81 hydroxylase
VQPEAEAAHFVGLEHFPNVTKAREAAMEVVLQPGDALYLPPYWIHHVISESTTIR